MEEGFDFYRAALNSAQVSVDEREELPLDVPPSPADPNLFVVEDTSALAENTLCPFAAQFHVESGFANTGSC